MFSDWHRKRREASNLPLLFVTTEEFIKRCMAVGMSEDEAKRQAKISKILNSSVAIGKERLTIND